MNTRNLNTNIWKKKKEKKERKKRVWNYTTITTPQESTSKKEVARLSFLCFLYCTSFIFALSFFTTRLLSFMLFRFLYSKRNTTNSFECWWRCFFHTVLGFAFFGTAISLFSCSSENRGLVCLCYGLNAFTFLPVIQNKCNFVDKSFFFISTFLNN